MESKHARKYEARPPRIKKERKKELRLDWNGFGFICAGVRSVGGYKRHVW